MGGGRGATGLAKTDGDVDQPRADVDSRQLADEVDFVPESDQGSPDEVVAAVFWRRASVVSRGAGGGEARFGGKRGRARAWGRKSALSSRRFGATPNAADEAMGQLEADVRMKENALEKAQRDLQDLRSRKAGGDVDLDDALYARGEQAKMVAHDVLSAVAVAPKGWSKRSIDRTRADRRGQPTAELDGRGYGGASRVGMPERAADAVYDVPETTTVGDHVASSEDAAKVLGKEAVEKLMGSRPCGGNPRGPCHGGEKRCRTRWRSWMDGFSPEPLRQADGRPMKLLSKPARRSA